MLFDRERHIFFDDLGHWCYNIQVKIGVLRIIQNILIKQC